jgi:pyrimidine deaminase RibD-like protein
MKVNELLESSDDEIHSYEKLDTYLYKLCNLIVNGQKADKEKFGMVAAGILDPDNNFVPGINLPGPNNTRRHAERVAIDNYTNKYGDIPEGSICITTCSPCSEHMDERYGESCTDLINQYGIKKVYAGFMDPTQHEEQREYNIMETANSSIRELCGKFADTFLNENLMGLLVKPIKQVVKKPATSSEEMRKYFEKEKAANLGTFKNNQQAQAKDVQQVITRPNENFADGRNPQDKGDSKRYGINTKASVSSLRKTAKQGGRKGQLAHWLANMKAGRAKKK